MMKATLIGCSVFFGVLFAASSVKAQSYYLAPPQAPDSALPGYYAQNYCGAWYGPNYYVYPPFQPFQGMVPGPASCRWTWRSWRLRWRTGLSRYGRQWHGRQWYGWSGPLSVASLRPQSTRLLHV